MVSIHLDNRIPPAKAIADGTGAMLLGWPTDSRDVNCVVWDIGIQIWLKSVSRGCMERPRLTVFLKLTKKDRAVCVEETRDSV